MLNYLADEISSIPAEDQSKLYGNVLDKIDLMKIVQKKIIVRFLKELQEDTVLENDSHSTE